ncbi:MAG TPA: hypothetical protein VGB02_16335 [Pyrinomonadaceae bacterium]|jgi:hypothetical protein
MATETPLHNEDQSKKKLREYLEKEMRQHDRAAKYKSLAAHLLLWIAIISSALATFNIKVGWLKDENVNVLAAVPVVILYIISTFKYEARARWHKVKARALQGFLFELDFKKNVETDELSIRVMQKLIELDDIKGELGVPSDKLFLPGNSIQPTANKP